MHPRWPDRVWRSGKNANTKQISALIPPRPTPKTSPQRAIALWIFAQFSGSKSHGNRQNKPNPNKKMQFSTRKGFQNSGIPSKGRVKMDRRMVSGQKFTNPAEQVLDAKRQLDDHIHIRVRLETAPRDDGSFELRVGFAERLNGF